MSGEMEWIWRCRIRLGLWEVRARSVRYDGPDWMALFTVLLFASTLGPALLYLAYEFLGWSHPTSVVLVALVLPTLRVHLRVRQGRARLVHTALGVPYWFRQLGREGRDLLWFNLTYDGDELVFPSPKPDLAYPVSLGLAAGDYPFANYLEGSIHRVLDGQNALLQGPTPTKAPYR